MSYAISQYTHCTGTYLSKQYCNKTCSIYKRQSYFGKTSEVKTRIIISKKNIARKILKVTK